MSNSIDPAQQLPHDSPQQRPGPFAEFFRLLMRNKAWWLPPLIIGLIVAAWLIFLGGPGRPEHVYPLV